MAIVGAGLYVRGEILAAGDLTIEGRVEGPVLCETGAVTIASGGSLSGNVVARDITVIGTVDGTLVASEVVEIRPEATVAGRVVATKFILAEGGTFNGTAEPQHLEAALRVARHRHQIPEAPPAQAPTRRPAVIRSLPQR